MYNRAYKTKEGDLLAIYVDLIFLENLFMNTVILYATAIVLKEKVKPIKILISSTVGGIYAIFLYSSFFLIFSNSIFKIFLSIVMVFIAYNPTNIKRLFKNLVMFYFTSFMFGGVTLALLHMLNENNIIFNNGVLKNSQLIRTIFIGGIVGFFIITIGIKTIKVRLNKQDLFCNIQIIINSKKLNVKAMIDTGNLLKEPITQAPVIIVEKEKLKQIISEHILNNMLNIENINQQKLGEYQSKIKLIPFKALGTKTGLLVGIKADNIIINYNEKYIYTENAIIGIYDNNFKKDYSGLIGLELITNEGGMDNEFIRNYKIKC